ncbi:MAG TPA: GSU2403 family nucleotidyltransferase fold protein [Allosphingosinicella sp.]|jgi:hypothetical protein
MRPILTRTLQTIFADLVEQVETAPVAGTMYTRRRGGIPYLYAKLPVGAERIDLFLGRAGDAEAIARADDLRRGMALARRRRRTVSMLRREGFAGPDRILGTILDSVAHAGLFRRNAVLVGTAAYRMSEALAGAFLPAPTLMTGDLDLATADLALAAEPPESFEAILRRADPSFRPVMPLDPRRPASRFHNADGFLVDLITPVRRRTDPNPMPLPALDAGAVPLQQLDWLIEGPVRTIALWGAGIAINVPRPARYAVHKLMLAQRRDTGSRVKRAKDLAQAQALVAALTAQDPFALEDALDDARKRGRKGWSEPIARSLAEIAAMTEASGPPGRG